MRALLSTHHLNTWSGSELVLIELGEALARRGFDITLYAPFRQEDFAAALDPSWDRLSDPAGVDLLGFDLVYCQHQVLTRILVRIGAAALDCDARPLLVYNHLSPFEPFEAPGPFCEQDVADLIWANSHETLADLTRIGGVFGRAQVVPNPAPDTWDRPDRGRGGELASVLSVSNHLPETLAEAFDLLRESGVRVTRLGAPDTVRRLQPSDLAEHDAVVCIGKTVQYAVRARCPVFCYDGFGGPGWLTADTFDKAGRMNFSGRDTPVARTPGEIADALRSGYAAAARFMRDLPDARRAPFHLEPYADRLVAAVEAHRQRPTALRARRARDASHEALDIRWRREARLYDLVDREYGQKQGAQLAAQALKAQNDMLRQKLAAAR